MVKTSGRENRRPANPIPHRTGRFRLYYPNKPTNPPTTVVNRMKAMKTTRQLVILASVIFCFASLAFGQAMQGLQMAELTEKLQLNEQQQKALTPIVAQR